jgi:catechol 2,3-dioxygenase-like lactoylglutathione lyase family enzyme
MGHGHHMEFIEYVTPKGSARPAQPNDATCGHVCLMSDDIEGDVARMLAAGATLQGRVTIVTTGPYKGAKAAYVRDPNGVVIELDQPA